MMTDMPPASGQIIFLALLVDNAQLFSGDEHRWCTDNFNEVKWASEYFHDHRD